jgi:DNA/RNA endonuclease YhcR with UshA esterase domain
MTEKKLPGHEQQPDDIVCSSCGRFVGALTRCPHCGARVQKRLSVRVTRYAALVLATLGLVLLYFMAVNKEIPVIEVAGIEPTMNFAFVRIEGKVTDDPRVYRKGDRIQSVRFYVDDGTGEIPITAYRAQAEELINSKQIPRMGDQVSVAGSLSVSSDDRIMLRLQSPRQLEIERVELPVSPIAALSIDKGGMAALVEAEIVDVRPPPPNSRAPWNVKLKDASGTSELSFWDDIYSEIADPTRLVEGQRVRARVSIGSYRGQLQLSLARGADLEFIGAPAAGKRQRAPAIQREVERKPRRSKLKEVMLEELDASMVGSKVITEGVVIKVYSPKEGSKAPHKLILEDGNASIAVIYWSSVAEAMEAEPQVGTRYQVRGEVSQYKDELQLKISFADQLTALHAPAKASSDDGQDAEEKKIGDVTKAMDGRVLILNGTLGEARSIPGGVIYPLDDDSGSILLLLWDRSVPGSARDALETGVRVRVKGRIKDYKGDLEIIPANPDDLSVLPGGEEA